MYLLWRLLYLHIINEYLQYPYPLTPAVVLVIRAAVAHVEAAVVAVARLAAEVEDDVGVGGVQLHLHTWCSDTWHGHETRDTWHAPCPASPRSRCPCHRSTCGRRGSCRVSPRRRWTQGVTCNIYNTGANRKSREGNVYPIGPLQYKIKLGWVGVGSLISLGN